MQAQLPSHLHIPDLDGALPVVSAFLLDSYTSAIMADSKEAGKPDQIFTSADRIRQLNEVDKVRGASKPSGEAVLRATNN